MPKYTLEVPTIAAAAAAGLDDAAVPVPTTKTIGLDSGEFLFVLGANGTGKSSLMWKFYSSNSATGRRIVSHRQNWFEAGGVKLTANERTVMGGHIKTEDIAKTSRWKDTFASHRTSMEIYDLIDSENQRARNVTRAADAGDMGEVERLAKISSPINKINLLLKQSNMPIELDIGIGEILGAKRNGGQTYDIAQLSDGERNALLIASNVLTAPNGSLFIIDEPERHLHRSIISPLLSLLFAERKDCAFVVSTHDVMLAADNPNGQKLLVRGCTHDAGQNVTAWDVDLVAPGELVDDALMRDVLGARRKVIFVEGTPNSLDLPLYTAIFPGVSVVSKSSCVDVQRAVSGIRSAANVHWVEAYGIVDGDARTPADLANLLEQGVYAVQAYSIESIYYHPEVQKRIAAAQVGVQGGDVAALVSAATMATIAAVRPHIDRLAARIVEKDIRAQIIRQIPGHEAILETAIIELSLDSAPMLAAECSRLTKACNDLDIETIICRYPIRTAGTLKPIATSLRFPDCDAYEAAVRQLMLSDSAALEFVRNLFGTLYTDLTA